MTDQVTLTVGYDVVNLKRGYTGEVKEDFYGRAVPKHAHGTYNLEEYSCSSSAIREAVRMIFCEKVNPDLKV